ncbi:MAG: lasso peptide biosynthesis PqqD family chaperone [Ardenticatenaceae bacterium]|nr:lasso peptide biosynthesis PqqD family chaperone [Ardenticatenaceae bacterium]
MTTINLENTVVRSDNFITSKVDDDIVMMSLEKGAYYALDDIGSVIWEQIDQPQTVADLCRHLMTKFDVEPAQCQHDVLAFLTDLASEGMIQIVR